MNEWANVISSAMSCTNQWPLPSQSCPRCDLWPLWERGRCPSPIGPRVQPERLRPGSSRTSGGAGGQTGESNIPQHSLCTPKEDNPSKCLYRETLTALKSPSLVSLLSLHLSLCSPSPPLPPPQCDQEIREVQSQLEEYKDPPLSLSRLSVKQHKFKSFRETANVSSQIPLSVCLPVCGSVCEGLLMDAFI